MSEHPPAEPHGPIEEFADGVLWLRGELTLVSAVRLSNEGEVDLERLGKVKNVVKIGYAHGMDDAYSSENWPDTTGPKLARIVIDTARSA